MRVSSRRRHVLALLREKVGRLQYELAADLGIEVSSMQKIELRSLRLSPMTARKASELFNVSVAYLLQDDDSKTPVTIDGKRWSERAYDKWRFPWGQLTPEERAWRLRNSELLLRGYLRLRSIVESFQNPEAGAALLDSFLERVLPVFAHENVKLLKSDRTEQSLIKGKKTLCADLGRMFKDNENDLESIVWDVQEVLKAAKELPPRSKAIRKKPLPPKIPSWKPLEPLTPELLRSDALA